VITWLWRGWAARKDADAYEHFLLTKLFPSMRTIQGFRGPDALRPGTTHSRIGDKAPRHVNPADGDVPAILLKGHVRVSVGEDGS
jgi:hypothetical protein